MGISLDYKAIGIRIRDKRISKKISQCELANIVGISNPHISNIERARTKVSLPTLIEIANALDTTLDELVCDNVNQSKHIYVQDIAEEIDKCNIGEIRIIADMIKTLVKNFRAEKNEGT